MSLEELSRFWLSYELSRNGNGAAWHGTAWLGQTWQGAAGLDLAGSGRAYQDKAKLK